MVCAFTDFPVWHPILSSPLNSLFHPTEWYQRAFYAKYIIFFTRKISSKPHFMDSGSVAHLLSLEFPISKLLCLTANEFQISLSVRTKKKISESFFFKLIFNYIVDRARFSVHLGVDRSKMKNACLQHMSDRKMIARMSEKWDRVYKAE